MIMVYGLVGHFVPISPFLTTSKNGTACQVRMPWQASILESDHIKIVERKLDDIREKLSVLSRLNKKQQCAVRNMMSESGKTVSAKTGGFN